MRRSRIKLFVHFVWTVKHREKRIDTELERHIHHCISSLALEMGCVVRAIGGTEDHIHLLLWMSSTLAPAKVVQKLKGVSSAMVNDMQNHEHHFRWQEHYAAFSVSPWDVEKVTGYILNQKQHHAEGTLIEALEKTDEEIPDAP